MKLTIAKETLGYALQAVLNAVSERQTLPILSNVLLRTTPEGLEVSATNLDIRIICTVAATVETQGSTTLPARRFSQIVNRLPTPLISLEINEMHHCKVTSGSVYFKLFGMAAEEFPLSTEVEQTQSFGVKAPTLKKMLERTAFAMSQEDNRAVLNGLHFSLLEKKLTLVATDGRRMALCDTDVESATGDGQGILPAKTVSELRKLTPLDGEVKIYWEGKKALFRMDGPAGAEVVLISKLMEGVYPNYKQVVPVELKHTMTLSREEFLHALARAQLMTSERSHVVKLVFGQNQLTISAKSMEVGEAQETLVMNHEGPELSISFNPTFLVEPLKTLDDGEVFLEMNDEFSPALLRAKENAQFVVMPMRSSD